MFCSSRVDTVGYTDEVMYCFIEDSWYKKQCF